MRQLEGSLKLLWFLSRIPQISSTSPTTFNQFQAFHLTSPPIFRQLSTINHFPIVVCQPNLGETVDHDIPTAIVVTSHQIDTQTLPSHQLRRLMNF
jgi:hypothetical protein